MPRRPQPDQQTSTHLHAPDTQTMILEPDVPGKPVVKMPTLSKPCLDTTESTTEDSDTQDDQEDEYSQENQDYERQEEDQEDQEAEEQSAYLAWQQFQAEERQRLRTESRRRAWIVKQHFEDKELVYSPLNKFFKLEVAAGQVDKTQYRVWKSTEGCPVEHFKPKEMQQLKCVHHFNFFGQPVLQKSGTNPATTIRILKSNPKNLNSGERDGSWKNTIMACATELLDPIIYYGNPADLYTLQGAQLERACTGQAARSYSHHGWWKFDDYTEDDYPIEHNSLDPETWPAGATVLNGISVGFLHRQIIIDTSAAEKCKEAIAHKEGSEAKAEQRGVPSRLSQVCLTQDDLDEVPSFVLPWPKKISAAGPRSPIITTRVINIQEPMMPTSSKVLNDKIAVLDARIGYRPVQDWSEDEIEDEDESSISAPGLVVPESSQSFNDKLAALDAKTGYRPSDDWSEDDDEEDPALITACTVPHESSQTFNGKLAALDAKTGYRPSSDWSEDEDEDELPATVASRVPLESSQSFEEKLAALDARTGYSPSINWADDEDEYEEEHPTTTTNHVESEALLDAKDASEVEYEMWHAMIQAQEAADSFSSSDEESEEDRAENVAESSNTPTTSEDNKQDEDGDETGFLATPPDDTHTLSSQITQSLALGHVHDIEEQLVSTPTTALISQSIIMAPTPRVRLPQVDMPITRLTVRVSVPRRIIAAVNVRTEPVSTRYVFPNGATTLTLPGQRLGLVRSPAMYFNRPCRIYDMLMMEDAGLEVQPQSRPEEVTVPGGLHPRIEEVLDDANEEVPEANEMPSSADETLLPSSKDVVDDAVAEEDIVGNIIDDNVTLTRRSNLTIIVPEDVAPDCTPVGEPPSASTMGSTSSSTPPTSAGSSVAKSKRDVRHVQIELPVAASSASSSRTGLHHFSDDSVQYSPSSFDQWPDFGGVYQPDIPERTSSRAFKCQILSKTHIASSGRSSASEDDTMLQPTPAPTAFQRTRRGWRHTSWTTIASKLTKRRPVTSTVPNTPTGTTMLDTDQRVLTEFPQSRRISNGSFASKTGKKTKNIFKGGFEKVLGLFGRKDRN